MQTTLNKQFILNGYYILLYSSGRAVSMRCSALNTAQCIELVMAIFRHISLALQPDRWLTQQMYAYLKGNNI